MPSRVLAPIRAITACCTPRASQRMLSAGHATNALPQRATANVNCRIFPGTTAEQVRHKLAELAGDPEIKVTLGASRSEVTKGPQTLSSRCSGRWRS